MPDFYHQPVVLSYISINECIVTATETQLNATSTRLTQLMQLAKLRPVTLEAVSLEPLTLTMIIPISLSCPQPAYRARTPRCLLGNISKTKASKVAALSVCLDLEGELKIKDTRASLGQSFTDCLYDFFG